MTDDFRLDLPLVHAGKVRRLYALPDEETPDRDPGRLLMVATDDISAFDHVLGSPIPGKGIILTQLSQWWFDRLDEPHHVVSTAVPEAVRGRAVIVEKLDMIPVECVVRGYLTGSGWAEYVATQTVCGIPLPAGLQDGSRLPYPIFTPAIKAPQGEHDENVDFAQMVELHGKGLAEELRARTVNLYRQAEEIARARGIILADTKVEYGRRRDGTLVLADEVLTPDSSRFWDGETWSPGSILPSYDKQFVRNWLALDSGWDRSADVPPPPLPAEVIEATRNRYLEAYQRLTGRPLDLGEVAPPEEPVAVEELAAPEDLVVGEEPVVVEELVAAEELSLAEEPIAVEETPGGSGAGILLVGGARSAAAQAEGQPDRDSVSMTGMARVVVDVMPKPEILDPQGKAVTGALQRLGFEGLRVRQGKRFEVSVEGDITDERLDQVRDAAEKLLANTVIESFDVRVELL
ncbi:MAG: phosphoribosylaminoimidazolesuccinocarboxamide synthase [Propioniciclava sp.]